MEERRDGEWVEKLEIIHSRDAIATRFFVHTYIPTAPQPHVSKTHRIGVEYYDGEGGRVLGNHLLIVEHPDGHFVTTLNQTAVRDIEESLQIPMQGPGYISEYDIDWMFREVSDILDMVHGKVPKNTK